MKRPHDTDISSGSGSFSRRQKLRFVARKVVRQAMTLGAGGSEGPSITRYAMYRSLQSEWGKLGLPGAVERPSVLAVGGSLEGLTHIGLGLFNIVEANHPQHDAASLTSFASDEFDVYFADQVIEHVEANPQSVAAESLRVVKPGGYVVQTTCLINPIHYGPEDLWRFTPSGLRFLYRDADIIASDGWGNPAVSILIALGLRSLPVPRRAGHPVRRLALWNDERWPVVTWVIARKPPVPQ